MRRINIAAPEFEYDQEDPDGFRSGMARLGKLLGGAEESGITVYELPPRPATVYPDSDKVGIWTGDTETDVIVRRESKVDYFDGE